MSGGLVSAFILPHDFRSPQQQPLPPHQHTLTPTMSSRKRKASDDDMDRMSSSPSPLPASLPQQSSSATTPRAHQSTPHRLTPKRPRTNTTTGRPLPLPRLLETLSAEDLRTLLRQLCTTHPALTPLVTSSAPKPSPASALAVLQQYASTLRAAFPYGDRATSDYAFNRIRTPLLALLDALRDYAPQFLPPAELHVATSLAFLDGATSLIHSLPDFDSFAHNRHKSEAYEEISAAWASVINQAGKRGAGVIIAMGGWEEKISRHNLQSGGRMGEALEAVRGACGWFGGGNGGGGQGQGQGQEMDERAAVRQQLMGGTYGVGQAPIEVGNRW